MDENYILEMLDDRKQAEVKIIICDMCEKEYESDEFNPSTPDRGLDLYLVGGYGLFHDDIENKCEKKVILCHACSLKLVRMIPKFANEKGWHSVSIHSDEYPLCCEYSWTFEDGTTETVYGTKDHFDNRKGE